VLSVIDWKQKDRKHYTWQAIFSTFADVMSLFLISKKSTHMFCCHMQKNKLVAFASNISPHYLPNKLHDQVEHKEITVTARRLDSIKAWRGDRQPRKAIIVADN
jgi:hypothetical protein